MNNCFKEIRAMKRVCQFNPPSSGGLRDHDYIERHLSCVSRPTTR